MRLQQLLHLFDVDRGSADVWARNSQLSIGDCCLKAVLVYVLLHWDKKLLPIQLLVKAVVSVSFLENWFNLLQLSGCVFPADNLFLLDSYLLTA